MSLPILKREGDAEIERLQELLDTKEKMLFKKPFYFMGEDPVPYCPK